MGKSFKAPLIHPADEEKHAPVSFAFKLPSSKLIAKVTEGWLKGRFANISSSECCALSEGTERKNLEQFTSDNRWLLRWDFFVSHFSVSFLRQFEHFSMLIRCLTSTLNVTDKVWWMIDSISRKKIKLDFFLWISFPCSSSIHAGNGESGGFRDIWFNGKIIWIDVYREGG